MTARRLVASIAFSFAAATIFAVLAAQQALADYSGPLEYTPFLVIAGCTIGTNALCVNGTIKSSGTLALGIVTPASSDILTVAGNGTNAASISRFVRATANPGNAVAMTTMSFGSTDGTNNFFGTSIVTTTTQAHTDGTNEGTKLTFNTVPNNSTTLTAALTLGQDQSAIIGGALTAPGTITFAGVTTGTNADFACFAAGGVMTLQTTACTISSLRFKEHVKAFADSALARIEQLDVDTYNLKPTKPANPDPNAARAQIGLIAENIARIEPRCAVYENDMKTPKSYRQECVIALLVKGIQEQQHEIRVLQARIKH